MRNRVEVRSDNDVEKASVSDVQAPSYRVDSSREPNYGATTEILPQGPLRRLVDSFKRDENQSVTPRGAIGADGRVYDPKNAALATATTALHRNLKARHLQMIAIGGSIGEIPFIQTPFTSLTQNRNWSLHCLRKGSQYWWSRFDCHSFQSYWCHALLHNPGSW
jgi:hypothetical protein